MLLLLLYRASVSLSRQTAVTCSLLVSWRGQREKRARELEEKWRYCSRGEPIARFAMGGGDRGHRLRWRCVSEGGGGVWSWAARNSGLYPGFAVASLES